MVACLLAGERASRTRHDGAVILGHQENLAISDQVHRESPTCAHQLAFFRTKQCR